MQVDTKRTLLFSSIINKKGEKKNDWAISYKVLPLLPWDHRLD